MADIHLKVAREASQVVISVSDTGIGISQELVPKIFDLFTQVHSKADRAQGGLGIGLALVRRLTEMHGGTVTARSEGLGGRHRVHRPPSERLATERVASSQDSPAKAMPIIESCRILVADDNHDAAESLALQLELAGHDVRSVHDGVEALAVAESFQAAVVVLDLGMPQTGWVRDRSRNATTFLGQGRHAHCSDRDGDSHRIGSARLTQASMPIS